MHWCVYTLYTISRTCLEMSLNIIFRLRYIVYPTHDDYGFPTKVDSVTCTQNSKEIYRTRF